MVLVRETYRRIVIVATQRIVKPFKKGYVIQQLFDIEIYRETIRPSLHPS